MAKKRSKAKKRRPTTRAREPLITAVPSAPPPGTPVSSPDTYAQGALGRPHMTHELKCWPEFYSDLVAGRRKFEVRFDDRDVQVGDRILFHEYAPALDNLASFVDPHPLGRYTGGSCRWRVTYVLRGHPGLKSGYMLFGLGPLDV